MDWLKNLVLDRPFKVMIAVGAIPAVWGVVTANYVAGSFGAFLVFFGFGEWKTHSEYYAEPNVNYNPKQTLMRYVKVWTVTGAIFYILAGLSLLYLVLHLP